MKAFFHEDDYGAVEILPVGAWVHCEQQLGHIAEHDVNRRAPDGLGWTSLYIREDSLGGDRLLHASGACAAHAGVGGGRYTALYASWDESGHVKLAFFSSSYVGSEKQPPFLAAMKALGELRPFLLMDWHADVPLRLDDTQMLLHWFNGEDEAED